MTLMRLFERALAAPAVSAKDVQVLELAGPFLSSCKLTRSNGCQATELMLGPGGLVEIAINPLEAGGDKNQSQPLCGAKNRDGHPCRRFCAPGRTRCYYHGGAPGSGAPNGERNGRYKDGSNTKIAIAERKWARALVRSLLNADEAVK